MVPEPSDIASSDARRFLERLWHLENDERPGFLIGFAGGRVVGGPTVRSALFSTEGRDTVRDRLQNPAKYLRAQLEEIEDMQKLKGDFVPTLCPALGVIGIPSAFGCDVVWWEKDFPAVRPCIGEDLSKILTLKPPDITDGELDRILRYTEHFIRSTNGRYPIRLTDIQGPLDSAALIVGHTSFLSALITDPDSIHALLRKVTDLTIKFAKAQRELVERLGAEFVPAMFQPWMPDGLGISVSNDECALISAALHDEFSVPYLSQISEEFGGIYVHSCGKWSHQIPSLKKVRGLRGVEFGASEAPFGPVMKAFDGTAVIAARIGLHRDLKFAGMADFVRRIRAAATTNRGLFIHVDITNGIVEKTWPVTDLDEIYALLLTAATNG